MKRLAPVLLALPVALAACGGATSPALPFPSGVKAEQRDVGGGWSVAWGTAGAKAYAVALHGKDVVRSRDVKLRILGPEPGSSAASIPQVAAEIKALAPIEDSTLLVDGAPIDTKGGGPSPSYISIYGAPAAPLAGGRHVAVAFARAGEAASAVAWTFVVR
ncbi:MAG TPA: hypothetical protein VLN26_06910 [Gaiellaceae bacterium]|nr:hypothetical protein [Gaiellaceae bacterium]